MSRVLALLAFAVGVFAVAWIGAGYLGSHALALTMTALIGAFYVAGGVELLRFHRATVQLRHALQRIAETAPDLGDWLGTLPPSLQTAVRLRVEGDRVALPGPALTPYLVGLLVVLGMLGTFLGMVVTLKGAVLALESTTDLATIRTALAAPVKGLGLAFGTSVAGVAASAMLGLVGALCRRERLQAAQELDTRIATSLRFFSRAHQRQQTLAALQAQTRVLPELLGEMRSMMAQMHDQGRLLNERLVAGQQAFQHDARTAYTTLAAEVGVALDRALSGSARAAGDTIAPAVQAAMAGIAHETAALQAGLIDSVQRHLLGLSTRLQTDAAAGDERRLAAWSQTLQAAVGAMLEQSQAHQQATAAGISRLLDSAAQAPRAAARIVALLRDQLADSSERDNELLAERTRLLAGLGTLLDATNEAATGQRAAVESLVESASALLQQAGARFDAAVDAESGRIAQAAAVIGAAAVDVASLGDAFGAAMQLFGATSQALTTNLQRIEAALEKSGARSDEQLAYCVAQAREVIELSLAAQKQVVDELQQLAARAEPVA